MAPIINAEITHTDESMLSNYPIVRTSSAPQIPVNCIAVRTERVSQKGRVYRRMHATPRISTAIEARPRGVEQRTNGR